MTDLTICVLDKEENSPLAKKIWLMVSGQAIPVLHFESLNHYIREQSSDQDILFISESLYQEDGLLEQLQHKHPIIITSDYQTFDFPFLYKLGVFRVLSDSDLETLSIVDFFQGKKGTKSAVKKGHPSSDLNNNNDLIRDALSISPDSLIIFDAYKRFVYASDHYWKVYKSFDQLFDKQATVEDAFEIMALEQGVSPEDMRYEEARAFWMALEGTLEITLDNGQTLRVVARKIPGGQGTAVTTTNVTGYKEQQMLLEQQSKALKDALDKEQRASAIQKQFISMVSHEFRTPLTIIDGNAQILAKQDSKLTTEQIGKRAIIIRSAVSRLITMMQSVLSSNMLETGLLAFQPQTFDLGALIQELVHEQLGLRSDLGFNIYIKTESPEVYLDPKMMTLILSNLISNAVKFCRDNPSIEIHLERKDKNLVLEIHDNGIGIPVAEQDKIFERFYRASNTTGITGTGIGLSLVKDLVEQQNGYLSVASIEGQGSSFYLTFGCYTTGEDGG